MTTDKRLAIGGNNPPDDIEVMGEKMWDLYKSQLAHAEQLLSEADGYLLEAINDDDQAGKVGDFIKQLTAARKSLDGIRTSEKEPWLAKGRAVDGFFKRFTEKLDDLKEKVADPLGVYTEKKKAEQARLREEKAQREREEAEAKLRESERLRREAEEQRQRDAAEAARKEAEAATERKRIADEAEAARIAQQKIIDDQRREREEADQRHRAEIQRMKDDADKKDAEAQQRIKDAEQARKDAAAKAAQSIKDSQEAAKKIEDDRREAEKNLREQERLDEQAMKDSARATKALDREGKALLDDADRHDRNASKMDRAALNVTGHTRGEAGSLTTTRKEWAGQMQDRASLDLEALRQHIPEDALHRAVQSFVDAGGRVLRGAIINEEIRTQVR